MPIIRIDWEKIKGRFDGRTQLFALTDQQSALLLSLTEQLTWDATFKVADYDFSDRDTLAAEVADTQRNLMMGVDLSDILGYIDDIEDLLEALQNIGVTNQPCCDTTGPVQETHEQTTEYPDTVPDTWGDTAIADLDEWQQQICGAAENYVEYLASMGDQLDDLVHSGAIVIAAIAGMLALLSGAGILLAITYGAAASITTGLITGAVAATFDNTRANIEAVASDIECAILANDPSSLADIIETAVGSVPWTLWFAHVTYTSAVATMIDGFNANGSLPDNASTDCDCEEDDIDDTEIYYNTVAGINHSYDSENGWWTIDSEVSSCDTFHIEWFSDAGKSIYQEVRVQVLTCHSTPDTCGTTDYRRGWTYDSGWQLEYTGNHAIPTTIPVSRFVEVHDTPFTATYRIFAT